MPHQKNDFSRFTVAPQLAMVLSLLMMSSAMTDKARAADVYGDAGVLYQQVTVDGVEFNPYGVIAKMGWIVNATSGLELHLASGVQAEEINSDTPQEVSVGLNDMAGLYWRTGTPHRRFTRAYWLFGVSFATLETQTPFTDGAVHKEYKHLSWGFVLEENFKSIPGAALSLAYTQNYRQGDDSIYSLSLGFKTNLSLF